MPSLVAQTVECLPTMQETQVRSLSGRPMEKEMATHSSILAWKIPWTEEPGWLQSMGSQKVGHNRATNIYMYLSFGDGNSEDKVRGGSEQIPEGLHLLYYDDLIDISVIKCW